MLTLRLIKDLIKLTYRQVKPRSMSRFSYLIFLANKTQSLKCAVERIIAAIKRDGIPAFDDVDMNAVEAICARLQALPVQDNRNDDEILGYDKDGLPT
jgi:hypothetical protein